MRARVLLSGLVLLLASAGCPGDLPRDDGKAPAAEATPFPDLPAQSPDQPWPTPDSYPSAPFGCETDDDCFGQACCPTAWGVRICAPSCAR